MFWTDLRMSTRKVVFSIAVLCIPAIGLIAGSQLNSADASTEMTSGSSSSVMTPTAMFAGTGTGSIPDGGGGTPPVFGAPRNVTFAVSGIKGNVVDVSVDMTLNHTFVGDVEAVLLAPGGTPSMFVVSRVGAVTVGAFGDNSNYLGLYNFTDTATGENIWNLATGACDSTCAIIPGTYRTTESGGPGQTSPPPVTSLNATFGGLTAAQANGTWTLRFRDAASTDTGTVSAANLTINGGPLVVGDPPLDYSGDGRSDFAVVRNVGSGENGAIRWFYNTSGTTSTTSVDWGIASDFFISGNWDTDIKDDVAVWRPGNPGTFYILRSSDATALIEQFGQTGDDPSVVADYNNDGRTDFAVYRDGAEAGDASTWYWRSGATPGGPVNFAPWGQHGDFPAPGDYDGDGNADFVVQRPVGGIGQFWRRLATGATDNVSFGAADDLVVPGDFDGDGMTDISVVRDVGGTFNWFYDPSGIPGVQAFQNTWGAVASDMPTQGDYDGDGRTDIGIWRASSTPGQSAFWVYNIANGGVTIVPFGFDTDYPVNNFNVR